MATIYDVAKRAEVSIATVSAVLNRTSYVSPKLTKRVLDAVDALDYTINHLAHSLQTRRTRTIGMLVPNVGSPDPFYGQVIRGAEDVFRRTGYLLVLGHTYNLVEEQSRYLAAFRARLVDGVLLFQTPGKDKELDRLVQAKQPVVFVGRVPSGLVADVVATDIRAGTRMGVDFLLRKGHRRVGMVTVAASMSVSAFRLEGWRAAHEQHGIAADAPYVIAGDLTADAGRLATLQLLDLPEPPTAIFADNLVVTCGILRALGERGISCPDGVEVVTSDDAEWLDVFRPPITAVVQPSYELGAQAAQMLLRRIQQPKRAAHTVLLAPELHVRT
jgi:LacI family transcriptional regulator